MTLPSSRVRRSHRIRGGTPFQCLPGNANAEPTPGQALNASDRRCPDTRMPVSFLMRHVIEPRAPHPGHASGRLSLTAYPGDGADRAPFPTPADRPGRDGRGPAGIAAVRWAPKGDGLTARSCCTGSAPLLRGQLSRAQSFGVTTRRHARRGRISPSRLAIAPERAIIGTAIAFVLLGAACRGLGRADLSGQSAGRTSGRARPAAPHRDAPLRATTFEEGLE